MTLTLSGITVRYGGVTPLDDVSMTFESGVCGIIGPNGAGKTTTFNVLSGFALPAAGTVDLDGDDLLAVAPHRRARWGLRRSFQQVQVVRTLTARENVLLAAEHSGAGATDVDRALDYVGLTRVHRHGSELTQFERRLVDLATCVVGSPRLVLLDEPAAGLDPGESDQLLGLITQIPAQVGALVLLVDHDMDLVRAACANVVVLDFGKRIAAGPTLEVLASPPVRKAYLGIDEEVSA
ncbi:ATP-binding cassette domain-containing protein [Xylanimonas allomyrinae]|uniref:ATP-binding cassette domain-containing protein n=1 Tax=Xylanimonas allomyrinae TaxID=2509459 RepID=A0A4P6EQL6_9MICO|nr:ATP-binding cassette domain-containing protein [Xylanimonas allomyrinae]QAY63719.1 ATP-binding cassette domain-containing protein [Xylanimonas allomyrinae]